MSACGYSFHDLSRVELSSGAPRFNMPFEVGLAVATARWRPSHQWFVFEARPFSIRRRYGTLFGARAFRHLVVAATDFVARGVG
jgi:hypothetical protein